jgi:hypothetical protein
MAQSSAITPLFLDVGNILLADSWSPSLRQKAAEKFGFDFAEVSERSRLTFEAYEEGHLSLDEYVTESLGMLGIHHTGYESTRAALAALGLSSGSGRGTTGSPWQRPFWRTASGLSPQPATWPE